MMWRASARVGVIAVGLVCLLSGPLGAQVPPPKGFIAPPLNPTSVTLKTQELAPGVYALVSGRPFVDNSGFVVGERGVLMIDARFNGAMARQIQAAVRRITTAPILYLVNTNSNGDQTFGNYAFPDDTHVIGQRHTAEAMRRRDIDAAKQAMLQTVEGDLTVYADAQLRAPDVVFERFLELDLGGRFVEVHFFGSGNTPGDTVVYVPEARVAWTGNLVFGDGTMPWLASGAADAYLGGVRSDGPGGRPRRSDAHPVSIRRSAGAPEVSLGHLARGALRNVHAAVRGPNAANTGRCALSSSRQVPQ